MAQPERVAVAICGDGGFLFTAQELATTVHYGLNVIAIVFNDGGYRSIEAYQRRRHGATFAAELANPDFVRFAQSFGAFAARAHSPDELADALRRAMSCGRSAVIEVPVEVEPAGW